MVHPAFLLSLVARDAPLPRGRAGLLPDATGSRRVTCSSEAARAAAQQERGA